MNNYDLITRIESRIETLRLYKAILSFWGDYYSFFTTGEKKEIVKNFVRKIEERKNEGWTTIVYRQNDIAFQLPVECRWLVLKNCKSFLKEKPIPFSEWMKIDWNQHPNDWDKILEDEYYEHNKFHRMLGGDYA